MAIKGVRSMEIGEIFILGSALLFAYMKYKEFDDRMARLEWKVFSYVVEDNEVDNAE